MDFAMVIVFISMALTLWFCLANVDTLIRGADKMEDDDE